MSASNKATYNVRRGKGFQCPTCTSFVPAGEDVCYNCGDMPGLGGGLDSTQASQFMVSLLYFFSCSVLSPVFYMLCVMTGNPDDNLLNLLILLPNLVILISVVVSLVKTKKKLGCIYGPIRLWVLVFSGLTAFENIRYTLITLTLIF